MSEDLKVDCFECKDLLFARNLIRQMKQGYGRHNSNLSFREVPETRRRAPGQQIHRRWTDRDENYYQFLRAVQENQQVRVIGRIGDHMLRERWQDCKIGDAVPESLMQGAHQTMIASGFRYIVHRVNEDESRFERVQHNVTSDRGSTWKTEFFWKRIS